MGSEPRRDRVPYLDAATAARAARARAVEAGIKPLEWRVLAVVIELTALYSKLEDRVAARDVARLVFGKRTRNDVTEKERQRVSVALASLGRAGVITYVTPKGGQHTRPVIGLPATSPSHGYVDDSNVPLARGATSLRDGRSNVPAAKGTTEKRTEKHSDGRPPPPTGLDTWVSQVLVFLATGEEITEAIEHMASRYSDETGRPLAGSDRLEIRRRVEKRRAA